jgi:hypothetical protein
LIVNGELDGIDGIVEAYPTDVLLSRSNFAAHAHLEGREQFREHPAFARENRPKAKIDHAHIGFDGRLASLFPFATDAGQKSTA